MTMMKKKKYNYKAKALDTKVSGAFCILSIIIEFWFQYGATFNFVADNYVLYIPM